MEEETPIRGVVYGIFMALAYSLMAIFVKLTKDTPNQVIVFYRSMIALFFISPWLYRKKNELGGRKKYLYWIRSLSALFAVYCYFYSLKHLSLLNSILLANTAPLFVPLVIWLWLKKRIATKRILSICIGFLGVVLLLQPTSKGWGLATLIGLGTGLFSAIALVGVRQLTKTEKPLSILFYFFLLSAFLSFFPFVIGGELFPEKGERLYVLATGLMSIIYQFFITKTYTSLPPSKAAGFLYLSLVFGGFFDWILWGKLFTYSTLLGVIFVAVGGFLTLYEKPKIFFK